MPVSLEFRGAFLLPEYMENAPEKEGNMKTVNGTVASAKFFNNDIEEYAVDQIELIYNNEAAKGSKNSGDARYASRKGLYNDCRG